MESADLSAVSVNASSSPRRLVAGSERALPAGPGAAVGVAQLGLGELEASIGVIWVHPGSCTAQLSALCSYA